MTEESPDPPLVDDLSADDPDEPMAPDLDWAPPADDLDDVLFPVD